MKRFSGGFRKHPPFLWLPLIPPPHSHPSPSLTNDPQSTPNSTLNSYEVDGGCKKGSIHTLRHLCRTLLVLNKLVATTNLQRLTGKTSASCLSYLGPRLSPTNCLVMGSLFWGVIQDIVTWCAAGTTGTQGSPRQLPVTNLPPVWFTRCPRTISS